MPQLKINSGDLESPVIPAFFIIVFFMLLLLSGCASVTSVPEGPAEATLAVEKGRVLVSHGEVYETGQDGMILDPNVRVIVLEGAKAKVTYKVSQESEETAFQCDVELEENSQLIVNGVQDCVDKEIVANNVNVTSPQDAAVEFSDEAESEKTATAASVNDSDEPAKPARDLESAAEPVIAGGPAPKQPGAADTTSQTAELPSVAAVEDIDLSQDAELKPPADMPSVGSIAATEPAPPPEVMKDQHNTAPVAQNRLARVDNVGAGVGRGGMKTNSSMVRKTVVSSKTIALPAIDMQSIAAVTKASDIPLVLQSLPQRMPGIKYIDAVILPDNS
jgi:PBP1b-binding outer membrane lipoprotein LpoB